MAGMDFTPVFDVIEVIGVASSSMALLNTLRRIISHMSVERFSERKVTLKLLAHRLELTIKIYERLSGSSALPAVVEERLKYLEKTAEELEKNFSSHMLRRIWVKLTHKGIDKRIGKLRTGISDIHNALTLPASLRAPAPDPAPAPAPAPDPAPAQIHVQMNFIFNQPCPVALNLDNGQVQGHNHGGTVDKAAPIDNLLIGFPKQV